ncbi:hypothetical protein DFJ73DRAFT_795231 [Zopfochytrium polystomum]|nr:hypothetical protein DFJ73DRAFT_795231 [Zopfochytrium polystomum]
MQQQGPEAAGTALPPPPPPLHSRAWRPYMYLPSLIMLSFSTSISTASESQFLLQKICLSHYLAHSSDAAAPSSFSGFANETMRCDTPEIQKEMADYAANVLYIAVVPSLLTSIMVGYSSDLIGRKPVITAMAIVAVFAVLGPYLVVSFDLPYQFFYLPAFLLGLSGGSAAIVSVGFATLVDITTTANRASVVGVYSGITTVISLVAVPLGGYITGNPALGDFDAFLPVFRLSSALGVVGILLLIFGTSETLATKAPRTTSTLKTILSTPAAILAKSGPALARVPVALLLMQIIHSSAGFRIFFDTQLSNFRFGWGPQDSSLFGFVDMVVSGVLTAVVLPALEAGARAFFNRREARGGEGKDDAEAGRGGGGPTEESPLLPNSAPLASEPLVEDQAEREYQQRKVSVKIYSYLMRFSLSGSVVGALIFATASQGWMWLAGFPVLGLVYVTGTCIRLAISEYVAPSEMALTNAIIGFIDSIAMLVTVRVAAVIYPHYYYLVAAIYAIVLCIALAVKLTPPPPATSTTDASATAEEIGTAGMDGIP